MSPILPENVGQIVPKSAPIRLGFLTNLANSLTIFSLILLIIYYVFLYLHYKLLKSHKIHIDKI